jgi:mono/diheme cytochrome c family protein
MMTAFAAVGLLCSIAAAQEPESGPPGRQRGGGAKRTREFLGLGPAPDEAAAAKGAPLYKQNCATCHGENGRGAQAPSLVRSVLVLHDEKGEEMGPVIKQGRPQNGMPGFPQLSNDDVYALSQYIHQQIELAANRGTYSTTYGQLKNELTGDVKRGEALFEARCKSCHSAAGDLAKIGSKYPQASAMEARMLWPVSPGPVKAQIKLPSGETVAATIKTLNDFDVTFFDAAGVYHSMPRSRVEVKTEDRLAGHRALLPQQTDRDIHDLTAYLVTLR